MTQTDAPQATRLSISDQLVQDLVEGLIEGRFVPGQRLVEPDLMVQYEVGRSTVREALKRLEAQGIVELQLNRGARIRRLTPKEAMQYLELTEAVYGMTARLAARNIAHEGHRALMEEAVVRLVQSAKETEAPNFLRARIAFQDALVTLSENPHLGPIFKGLQVHILRQKMIGVPEHIIRSFRATATAVLDGDPDRAEQTARAHIRKLMAQLTEKEG